MYCCIKCKKSKWKVEKITHCVCLISFKNEELYLMDLHGENECDCTTTPYMCPHCCKQNEKLSPNYVTIECIVCHQSVKQCCGVGFYKIIKKS